MVLLALGVLAFGVDVGRVMLPASGAIVVVVEATDAQKLIALDKRHNAERDAVSERSKWLREMAAYERDSVLKLTPTQRAAKMEEYKEIWARCDVAAKTIPDDLATFKPDPKEYLEPEELEMLAEGID